MHDDDETRFPRITLWQVVSGIGRLFVRFDRWPTAKWFADAFAKPEQEDRTRSRKDTDLNESDQPAQKDRRVER